MCASVDLDPSPRALPSEVLTLTTGRRTGFATGTLHWIGEDRTLAAGVGTLAIAMVAAGWITGANASYIVVVCAAVLAGTAIASVESDADRLTSVTLLVWALAIRVFVLTTCFVLAAREGGPFLGPDSSQYYYGSVDLARRALFLPSSPVIYFGSYDVGQYYLFAAAMRFAAADLFGLQMLNCALTAIGVTFVFGIGRLIAPRGAIWIALITAVHPALLGLSAIDLLKDPSIVCTVLGLLWVLPRLAQAESGSRALAFSVVALALAAYLRVSRFYAFAYIEAALAISLVISLIARQRAFRRPLALTLLVVVLTAVEVVPMRALWPPTPVLFVAMAGHTLNTPAMRWANAGLFERSRQVQRGNGVRIPNITEVPEEGRGSGLVGLAVGAFRRMFGPYPWILPRAGSFRALQDGQFYLLPGMLLWYAVLPLIVIGLGRIAMGQWRFVPQPFAALLLAAFVLIYFAQYLLINLSYRQREVMLPILLVFGWLGFEWVQLQPSRLVRRCYASYGAAFAVLAALHIAARAWMSSR